MSYCISDYLNEKYKEQVNPIRKLGKYEIRSYIDVNDNQFEIVTECEELKLKHTEDLGVDIKLSAFPDYYEEINECFEEMAKDIFQFCQHLNKKELTCLNEITLYDCFDCGITFEYDKEFDDFNIKEINWNWED